MKLQAGDKVLHKKARRIAYVIQSNKDGSIRLDRPIDGFYHWHEAELKLLEAN